MASAPKPIKVVKVETALLTIFHIAGKPRTFHREDGPAVVYEDGHREWWVNGRRHRENGPAIIYSMGDEEYYLDGLACNGESGFIEKMRLWRQSEALTSMEKFVDKHGKKQGAGDAIISFLSGECSHSYLINETCELCGVRNQAKQTPKGKVHNGNQASS